MSKFLNTGTCTDFFCSSSSSTHTGVKKFTQLYVGPQINGASRASLREEFITFLKLTDNTGRKLANIVSHKKNNCNLKFYPTELENVLIVMVHCPIDSVLIRLAKECMFPRGFPIIWKTDTNEIEYKGFYPKFSNDVIGQSAVESKDFEGANEIVLTKKYSGFLGQVMAFESGRNYYWFSTCKNTASGPMIDDLSEIVRPYVTFDLVHIMVTEKIHFCGECMSIRDRTHGAAAKESQFVVTFVAKGHTFKPEISSSENVKFLSWLSNDEKVRFCKSYGLLIDIYYHLSGRDTIATFMHHLISSRNTMTNEKFDTLMYKTTGEVSKLHQSILGSCLEGLIIFVRRKDETSIIKFKFPFYTFRTMFVRQTLSKQGTLIFPTTLESLDLFLERWVVPGSSAVDVYRWCLEVIERYQVYHGEYQRYLRTLSAADSQSSPSEHIFIADKVPFPSTSEKTTDMLVEGIGSQITQIPLVNLIVIVGPIGYGKSTRGRQLEESKSSEGKFVHIDGDLLNLGSIEKVLKLGQERNGLTKYLICEAIRNGKIPVLSCGGGVIMNRSKIGIINELQKVFSGVRFHLHVFHPTNLQTYVDHKRLQSVLTHRGWDNLKMFQKICGRNKAVVVNIQKHCQEADDVTIYTYPSWEEEWYFPGDIMLLSNPKMTDEPTFYQHRILADYGGEKMGHITVSYNPRGVPLQDLSRCQGVEHGSLITFGPENKPSKVMVIKSDHFGEELNSRSHITVNPGKHQPVDMKTFTLGYNTGQEVIRIGDDKYSMDSLKIEPVEVNLHGDFYLLY